MLKTAIKRFFHFLGLNITKKSTSEDQSYPVEASDSEIKLIENASRYSMTGRLRMWALLNAVKHVTSKDLQGDFVECGVWRGGNLILMAQALEGIGKSRKIWGFDTFSGMSDPSIYDTYPDGTHVDLELRQTKKDENVGNIHAFASYDLVITNLRNNSVRENIELVKGPVEETLFSRDNLPDLISILRLDTDWYESTKVELEILYPKLVKGGVLIIDDYGHFSGARKAVDEYFGEDKPWMHYVDYTCRLLIKE